MKQQLKLMSFSKLSLKTVFILVTIVSIGSCEKNERFKKKDIKNVLTTKNNDETEVYFFTSLANTSQSIILKSQLAQYKSLEQKTKDIGFEIENSQTLLLQDIKKLTFRKLIIITDLNTAIINDDFYKQTDTANANFDKIYINSIINLLYKQIELLETITKETNDTVILKLVTHYLPKQYEFLRKTKRIKNQLKQITN
ncbi:hypothetical protein ACEN2I_03075 [Flavobacterium sp. W22_SRS_FK3]|uniref:DUF4142 domain-containing protein n=1 Tax=Flavobacterium sp. W22_SRS_FK3 TaxID=3240275 RepID=UPI003F93A4EE